MKTEFRYNRIIREISQDKLAEMTGLSQTRISRIERGITRPTDQEIEMIAQELKKIPTILQK